MDKKTWWKNLQPLRIPPLWQIIYNKLEQIEPDELDEKDAAWLFTLTQDILYMQQKRGEQTLSIDLGWYPDGDPQGTYRLVFFLDDDIFDPLLEMDSRNTQEIVETLEFWLFDYIPQCQPIDEKVFANAIPTKK